MVIRVQPVVLIDVGLKIRGVLPAGKISAHNEADEVPLLSAIAALLARPLAHALGRHRCS